MDDREREVLKSMVGVIWADGQVTEQERAILGNILLQLGYQQEDINEVGQMMKEAAPPDLEGLFPRADERRKLMRFLVNMSMVDGHFDTSEVRYLNLVARQLKIEPEALAEIRAEAEKSRS